MAEVNHGDPVILNSQGFVVPVDEGDSEHMEQWRRMGRPVATHAAAANENVSFTMDKLTRFVVDIMPRPVLSAIRIHPDTYPHFLEQLKRVARETDAPSFIGVPIQEDEDVPVNEVRCSWKFGRGDDST
jgi:hypothetical protein